MTDEILNTVDIDGLAILLVDMQDFFIDSVEKENLIPVQIKTLLYFRRKNVPIIVVEYCDYGDTDQILQHTLGEYAESYYLLKHDDSGFSNPELDSFLRTKDIKTLLIMGINASECILLTSEDAISKGYKVITSNTLMAGYFDERKKNWPGTMTEEQIKEWYEKNTTCI